MKKTLLTGALALLLGIGQAHADDKTIDISYVKAPFNLQMIVMKEQGLLENRRKTWHGGQVA